MSLGPIPFTAILEYSRLYDVGDFEEFLYLIRAMDNTILELESKKAKAQSAKAKNSGRQGNKNHSNGGHGRK